MKRTLQAASLLLAACAAASAAPLKITASSFPVYDFARRIAGDKASVSLLIPPGSNAHLFEPSASDTKRLAEADLFVYVSDYMEPWAKRFALKPGAEALAAGRDASCIRVSVRAHGGHSHGEGACDPHIWLDVSNAVSMSVSIASALERKDKANSAYYRANVERYARELDELDRRFKQGLSDCKVKTVVHAGHSAFAYMAARYGLQFVSASGVTGDTEPAPSDMLGLAKALKRSGAAYLFTEERMNQRFSKALQEETGVKLLPLQNIGSISRQEFKSATYLSLMEENLAALRTGLSCGKP